MITASAATFAAILPGLLVAHTVADHWCQSHHQATHKHLAGWSGRLACARHVGTYTATTAGTVALLWWALALEISPLGFVLGQLISAVTHYWADRRSTLARLCELIGKSDFHRLGTPRDVQTRVSTTWSGGTWTTVAPAPPHVELVDTDGRPVSWDNPSLGTGAYALDQSRHWAWLFVAALITAVV